MKATKAKIIIVISVIISFVSIVIVVLDTFIPSIIKAPLDLPINDSTITLEDSIPHDSKALFIDIEEFFIPSGYLGDAENNGIKMFKNNTFDCLGKNPCFKFVYSPKTYSWGGLYWQYGENNWGERKGIDLSNKGISKVTFWAKGEKGGETILFKAGGIIGRLYNDSFESSIEISLTVEWKQYSIDLKGKDLSNVIGGFCWVISGGKNYGITTFYIDRIRYEK